MPGDLPGTSTPLKVPSGSQCRGGYPGPLEGAAYSLPPSLTSRALPCPPQQWTTCNALLGEQVQSPVHSGRGRGGDCGQGASNPIAKNCGQIAGKLRYRNQTSRSLKEQLICAGDTQGTCTHTRWTRRKQLRKNSGKLRKIADLNPPVR